MQLMPKTATELGVANSFDPNANVQGGSKYLRELLQRYNYDMVKALAAYNAGPQRVDNTTAFRRTTRRAPTWRALSATSTAKSSRSARPQQKPPSPVRQRQPRKRRPAPIKQAAVAANLTPPSQ